MRWRPWIGCCGRLKPATWSPSPRFRSDRRSSATCASAVAFQPIRSWSGRWSDGRENKSDASGAGPPRSEEGRVGEEGRFRWWPDHLKKKNNRGVDTGREEKRKGGRPGTKCSP